MRHRRLKGQLDTSLIVQKLEKNECNWIQKIESHGAYISASKLSLHHKS